MGWRSGGREGLEYSTGKDSRKNRQSHMRTPPVAPVEIVVHGQHLPKHESTQLRGAGSDADPRRFLTWSRLRLGRGQAAVLLQAIRAATAIAFPKSTAG